MFCYYYYYYYYHHHHHHHYYYYFCIVFGNKLQGRLFEKCITLSTGYITIRWIAWLVSLTLNRWIAIYPVGSVIQPLNNRSLVILWSTYTETLFRP